MKSKITILTIVGLLAGSIAASAQTNPGDAGEAATPSTAVAETTTSQPNAIIPLISFDDALLSDAIKNLARLAGLNYMLDPKMSYGQPGPDGRPAAQPTVSIRWENITAEQALMALLNNYNLQLIQDPKTGIARITTKDPAAPDPLLSKVIQLNYADPKDMMAAVQTALTDDKRSKVVADERTSQLVVLATEKQFEAVDELIKRLDSVTKQVLIEAKIYETSSSPSTAKGINWSGTLSAQNFAFGNNLQTTPVTAGDSVNAPLATAWPKLMFDSVKGFNPATAFLDADGVNAVLSFLNSDTDTRVVATPRAVTLDNQTAILSSTRATPIFNTTAGTQGSPGGSSVTYSNLGVILNVTPRISANNDIQLKVVPEVSSDAGPSKPVVVAGVANQAELFDIRRIDTQVLIPSGNTLVLGGLLSDTTTKGYTKVPVMGDVPGLGFFFRSKSKQQDMKNLLIFITPTIVTPEAFKPTKTEFLNSKVDDKPFVDPTAWDSAKPVDWSKAALPEETSVTKR